MVNDEPAKIAEVEGPWGPERVVEGTLIQATGLDDRQKAAVNRAQAKFLLRKAGQMDQHERAAAGVPPRAVMRAVGNAGKVGRRGAKARARIRREALKRGLPWGS